MSTIGTVKCGICRQDDDAAVLNNVRRGGFNTLIWNLGVIGSRNDVHEYCSELFAKGELYLHPECRNHLNSEVRTLLKGQDRAKSTENKKIKEERSKRRSRSASDASISSTSSQKRPRLQFKNICILCTESTIQDARNPARNKHIRKITSLEAKPALEKLCKERIRTTAKDSWALEVLGRINSTNDLVAEEGGYHISCFVKFSKLETSSSEKGRKSDSSKLATFCAFCSWFEDCMEDQVFTLGELYQIMVSDFCDEGEDEAYSYKRFKLLFLDKFSDIVFLSCEVSRKDVICLKDSVKHILRQFYKDSKERDDEETSEEDREKLLLQAAAKMLVHKIRSIKIDCHKYPSVKEFNALSKYVPEELNYFLSFFVRSEKLRNIWGQNFISVVRPRSGPMPHQLGLACQMDHHFASRLLVDKLHKLGVSTSYAELQNYKWSVLKWRILNELKNTPPTLQPLPSDPGMGPPCIASDSSDIDENVRSHTLTAPADNMSIISDSVVDSEDNQDVLEEAHNVQLMDLTLECDEEVAGILSEMSDMEYDGSGDQVVADNLDVQVNSVTGENKSIHVVGRALISPEPTGSTGLTEPTIPRKKIVTSDKPDILKQLKVEVKSYCPNKDNGLANITFMPIKTLLAKFNDRRPELSMIPGDIAWIMGWAVQQRLGVLEHSFWKGFMKSIHYEDYGDQVSKITFLPIIDAPPDNFSAIYTTIMESLSMVLDKSLIITFDLPLWVKATRIVMELNLPVVTRLGGFHLAKSFLGCIGFIMRGSGIEECLRLIHPEDPAHILSGAAYYKAVRAYIIIDAAFISYLFEKECDDGELMAIADYIEDCKDARLGCSFQNELIESIGERLEAKLKLVRGAGKTQKLWVEFHKCVTLLKDFIRSERLGDFKLYLKTIAKMLPFFAAAGHGQYAKAIRLTLEQVMKLEGQEKAFFFAGNHHTVKYSNHQWSGVSTDLSIEQTLMRYCKSEGGLSDGRLRSESSKTVWLLTLPHFSEINQSMSDNLDSHKVHLDLGSARKKKDYQHFLDVRELFEATNLAATEQDAAVSFGTGLVSRDQVNSFNAHEIGMTILSQLDGGNFTSKISIKMKCKNFDVLKKRVKINNKSTILQSMQLFNRLALVSQRQLTVAESLQFELTVLPTSMFDEDQFMRDPSKSKFGQHLKEKTTCCEPATQSHVVIDGGWMMYQVSWSKDSTYSELAENYTSFVLARSKGRKVTLHFDGYSSSTKDHEHRKRSKKSLGCPDVIIQGDKKCQITREQFLSNVKNKASFIEFLCSKMNSRGIVTAVAADDCDTKVVRSAIDIGSDGTAVQVIAEDTDILVMLIYHVGNKTYHQQCGDIYFTSRGGSYDIKDVCLKLTETELLRLLLIYALTGCDTVSGLYGKGKVAIFKKLCKSTLKDSFEVITSVDSVGRDEILDHGTKIFQYIYGDGNTSMGSLRLRKFNSILTSSKGVLKPELLPPTQGAVQQHVLRAYLQYHDWCLLSTGTLPQAEYGWTKTTEGSYEPVGTDNQVAPDQILKITACACTLKSGCSSARCVCRAMGMTCIDACKNCRGNGCNNSVNSSAIEEES